MQFVNYFLLRPTDSFHKTKQMDPEFFVVCELLNNGAAED
jgi:hypothetical protein